MRFGAQTQDRRRPGATRGFRRSLVVVMLSVSPAWGCTVMELPEEERNGRAGGAAGTPAGAEGGAAVDSAGIARGVTEMLHASADSWNAGDLEGFLDDYWPSEQLTFSGASGVTRGWEGVRERYQRTYWAPGAQRDSLRFEALEVMPLGEDHALALGKYVLYRPEEEEQITSTGFFSLVLRQIEGEWTILHDHTSATPPS